jgi:hypothetical protein
MEALVFALIAIGILLDVLAAARQTRPEPELAAERARAIR